MDLNPINYLNLICYFFALPDKNLEFALGQIDKNLNTNPDTNDKYSIRLHPYINRFVRHICDPFAPLHLEVCSRAWLCGTHQLKNRKHRKHKIQTSRDQGKYIAKKF